MSYSKLTPNLNYTFYVGSSDREDIGPKNKAKYIKNYKKETHMQKMKTSFKSRQTFKTSILVKMEHEEGGRQALYHYPRTRLCRKKCGKTHIHLIPKVCFCVLQCLWETCAFCKVLLH